MFGGWFQAGQIRNLTYQNFNSIFQERPLPPGLGFCLSEALKKQQMSSQEPHSLQGAFVKTQHVPSSQEMSRLHF